MQYKYTYSGKSELIIDKVVYESNKNAIAYEDK